MVDYSIHKTALNIWTYTAYWLMPGESLARIIAVPLLLVDETAASQYKSECSTTETAAGARSFPADWKAELYDLVDLYTRKPATRNILKLSYAHGLKVCFIDTYRVHDSCIGKKSTGELDMNAVDTLNTANMSNTSNTSNISDTSHVSAATQWLKAAADKAMCHVFLFRDAAMYDELYDTLQHCFSSKRNVIIGIDANYVAEGRLRLLQDLPVDNPGLFLCEGVHEMAEVIINCMLRLSGI